MTPPSTPAQEPAHPHTAELVNPDGSWKYTNSLTHETSPYLLQHAHNPVDWHPWGSEAFELARRSGKPIFLSIGYSTCYWCHVMERQVFENPQLAALLNEHFVSIKVDREERPDVDDIYMTAVQMMTGRGGWPMSVFLTPPGAAADNDPGLKPFWAGTYIPPEPRHGIPGFGELVQGLSQAWQTQRKGVIEQAQQVAQAVREHLDRRDERAPLGEAPVQNAANQLMRIYDRRHGGFGQSPKFPQPGNLLFLLKVYQTNPHDGLWKKLAYTLERMAGGGMYDQVGGGFHRYATDEKWLVPHFEKMLYDNAQLIETYLTAQAIHPDPADPGLYERVARETCDYVLREMTDPTGAFWSAQDAEVDAREGGNYVWTPQEVRDAVVTTGLGELPAEMYGLDRGTNFQDPHHPDEPPTNVLYLPLRLDELAAKQGMTLDALLDARAQVNRLMLAVRDKRKQPSTDDKALVSWNGMMIAALARAGHSLDEPRYTQAASRAAAYILDHMRPPLQDTGGQTEPGTPTRGLYRSMRGGEAKIPAFLEDYAFFVHGLIELNRSTGQDRWLDAAKDLTTVARQQFTAADTHGGGYYDTLDEQADLFVRTVSTYDGAIPTGNSQMIHNLLDLHELTGNEAYLGTALTDLASFGGALAKQGAAMVHMQHALLRAIESAPERIATAHEGLGLGPGTTLGQGQSVATRGDAVSVSVEPHVVELSPEGVGYLQVTIDIAPGHHLNASDTGLVGLVPTRLELESRLELKLNVDYPPGVTKRYPFAEDDLQVYEGRVVLEAVVRPRAAHRKGAPGDPDEPRLVLRYQVCTETSCLEPQEVELPVTFTFKDTP